MSSLRPLATIALLAAVGVFLYMKINDSEPKLPPELEEWSTSTLEVGEPDAAFADVGAPAAAPAATAPASTMGGDAPPFASAQLSAAPTAQAATSGDAAPPWTPPIDPPSSESPASSAGGDAESSPVARSAETPALPQMPPAGSHSVATAEDAAVLAGAASAAAAAVAGAQGEDAVAGSTETKSSLFAAARVRAYGALDRGELAQALQILSEWYGDPSLTPMEKKDVDELLAQLAGSVIYEGPPAHRLLPAHIVQAGETLESVASQYNIPWQLLAKINGVSGGGALQTGQELKVVPGPFSALIDLSERNLTLMLGRKYAGKFALEIDPATELPESEWTVDQKLLTPANPGMYAAAGAPTEDRTLLLANADDPASKSVLLRGPGSADPVSPDPTGAVIRLKAGDVQDVYDILSVGSRVTIRR